MHIPAIPRNNKMFTQWTILVLFCFCLFFVLRYQTLTDLPLPVDKLHMVILEAMGITQASL